jgi:hypothetical protein
VPVPVVHERKVIQEIEKYVDVPRPYQVIKKVPYEVQGEIKARKLKRKLLTLFFLFQ